MELFQAMTAAVVADGAVLLSFFDDRIIDRKVHDELSGARKLTDDQKHRIAQMCNGASTLLAFFANAIVLLTTFVLTLKDVRSVSWSFFVVAAVLFIVVSQIVHLAATAELSSIDDLRVFQRLSLGAILRIELMILNVGVFGLAALA